MKFDQLAVVTDVNTLARQQCLMEELGAQFTEDVVEAVGCNASRAFIQNVAHLLFDYQTWPMEFELLCYVTGWNWHMLRQLALPTVSHFGVHIDSRAEMEVWRERSAVLQEVVTISHTNPEIASSRRYHYMILDMPLGAQLKLIRRLSLAEAADLEQELRDRSKSCD